MKYIKKTKTPDFFIEDTKNIKKWSEYYSKDKRKLKEYILENEQYYLCCYCEKKVTIDKLSSHIEHIEPKSNKDESIFDYKNLLVSCEGNHGEKYRESCGHFKDNNFNKEKFLNPTLIKDIDSYFRFDIDTGEIFPASKDKLRAKYTINLLNLNGENNIIAEARKKTKESLISTIYSPNLTSDEIIQFKDYLNGNHNEFITFLRYIFREFI